MRLVLVRHGHTADSDALVYAGQRDTPLSPVGERHALALGRRLAAEPLADVFSSDLVRARATAERIAPPHGLGVTCRGELRELAMGTWEGRTYDQLAQDDTVRLARWIADPEHTAPPGGETAEALRRRVRGVLLNQCVEYTECTIAWITHGGVIGVLLCDLLGLPIAQRWRLRCDVASITTVEVWIPADSSHPMIEGALICLNDTSHLKQL